MRKKSLRYVKLYTLVVSHSGQLSHKLLPFLCVRLLMMFDCLLLSYSCKRMTCNVDFHVDKIERCCRTCAKFIKKDRVTYLCNEKRIENKLRDVWNVRPAENDTVWCPQKICNNCWIKLNKFEKQNTCIETPTKSFRIYSWLPDEEQNGEQGGCTVRTSKNE